MVMRPYVAMVLGLICTVAVLVIVDKDTNNEDVRVPVEAAIGNPLQQNPRTDVPMGKTVFERSCFQRECDTINGRTLCRTERANCGPLPAWTSPFFREEPHQVEAADPLRVFEHAFEGDANRLHRAQLLGANKQPGGKVAVQKTETTNQGPIKVDVSGSPPLPAPSKSKIAKALSKIIKGIVAKDDDNKKSGANADQDNAVEGSIAKIAKALKEKVKEVQSTQAGQHSKEHSKAKQQASDDLKMPAQAHGKTIDDAIRHLLAGADPAQHSASHPAQPSASHPAQPSASQASYSCMISQVCASKDGHLQCKRKQSEGCPPDVQQNSPGQAAGGDDSNDVARMLKEAFGGSADGPSEARGPHVVIRRIEVPDAIRKLLRSGSVRVIPVVPVPQQGQGQPAVVRVIGGQGVDSSNPAEDAQKSAEWKKEFGPKSDNESHGASGPPDKLPVDSKGPGNSKTK